MHYHHPPLKVEKCPSLSIRHHPKKPASTPIAARALEKQSNDIFKINQVLSKKGIIHQHQYKKANILAKIDFK